LKLSELAYIVGKIGADGLRHYLFLLFLPYVGKVAPARFRKLASAGRYSFYDHIVVSKDTWVSR